MLYEIAKPFVMAVVRAVWAPTLSGHENIPEQGPVILASNHLTYADTVFLPGQVRRSVHFLGKSDIFTGRAPIARRAGSGGGARRKRGGGAAARPIPSWGPGCKPAAA